MAEPDGRTYEVKHLEEQLRLERGTIDYLEALVEGLQYELHVREIRLKEKDKRIAELEQRVREEVIAPSRSPEQRVQRLMELVFQPRAPDAAEAPDAALRYDTAATLTVAEAWRQGPVTTRYEATPGNHFTVLDPLTDANSAMTKRVVELARAVQAETL